MSVYRQQTLPYQRDSAHLIRRLAALPGLVCLDSGLGDSPHGRYDILSALPSETLRTAPGASPAETFRSIDALLARHQAASPADALASLPFQGGAIGYVGYDGASRVGLYHWAIIVDHQARQSRLLALPQCSDDNWKQVQQCLSAPLQETPPFELEAPFRANFTQQEYADAFARIQDYIHAGDCYQVNLAQRFASHYAGNPLTAWLRLRTHVHSPFAAYMEAGDETLLSFSPERFLRVRDGQVLTQPIKGTRRRAEDPTEDRALAAALLSSPKDRAENLMIVDLLRNDLGTLCATGSVKVEQLFELQSFSNVHHLVSTISARLDAAHTALALLGNCFPGGSITGAPKKRAMEIIEELEPDSRQAYCGTFFHAGFNGSLDSSILIRSLVCRDSEVFCWGGGGIVADSECAQEYQECYDKIDNIIKRL
ncbi:MAG: aminodeoxychorismate synthase component I [Pseudomonadales bacterium]|nr:aminodeoxychorismate synthase component I [Pseudomonadales bacterium]